MLHDNTPQSTQNEEGMAGPARAQYNAMASSSAPTLRDLQCTLDHHLQRLAYLNAQMNYKTLLAQLCGDILPLVSTLANRVNQ